MATTVAYIGPVRFEQHMYESLDARCQCCDWREPWNGAAMMLHAVVDHGVDLGGQCMECAVATFNYGLPDLCDKHAGLGGQP